MRASHLLGGLGAKASLRSGADQHQVGVVVAADNVAALLGLGGVSSGEVGKGLAGETNDGGGLVLGEGDLVSGVGLVGVAGAEDVNVGHGAEGLDHLDGLVGGPVLPEADAVVGHDVKDAELGQGGAPDGAKGVAGEIEEGGAVGADVSVGEHAVADSGHGVLTDAEANVPAGRRGRLEVARALEAGKVGGGQVGGASHELGEVLGDTLCVLRRG